MDVNWTNITTDFMDWSMQGYSNILGVFMWPVIFSAVIGYVYLKQQSAVAAAVAILIIFAAFSNAMLGVENWTSLMHIFVSLIATALFLLFLTRMRR